MAKFGLPSREPFLLRSRPNLGSFTIVSNQIPTGGSTDVGREYTNVI
jgi:hypothetical protein